MKRLCFALLLLAAGHACAPLPLPGIGRSGDPSIRSLVENRVWIETDAVVPGTARAWLSSGDLLTISCFATPGLAEWRWTGAAELEWAEGEERIRAEVAAAGPDELALLIGVGAAPRVIRLTAARKGGLC